MKSQFSHVSTSTSCYLCGEDVLEAGPGQGKLFLQGLDCLVPLEYRRVQESTGEYRGVQLGTVRLSRAWRRILEKRRSTVLHPSKFRYW